MELGASSRDGAAEPTTGEERLLRKAEALFHEALEQPSASRAEWLEGATPDVELRALVADLLGHHRDDERLTALDGLAGAGEPTDPAPARAEVGRFRLERELGRGGMGIVYEAEDPELGRRVALKLAGERLPSRALTQRFEREERVLARLQHPNIAQLYDAGVTTDGVPYFAMELVDGANVVSHATDEALGLDDRLGLFLAVCDALQFAHRSLVVHRDVKPSNVLVTADGVVKLLDFGVAKLLEDAEAPSLTRTEARIYTPGYAAPEQLLGEPVTTATDVYQLGALLYELLAGVPAFDVTGLTAFEAERRVLETDAPAPSRTATANGTAIPTDLDSIALKALEKEPERRYASVDALASDVRRFLAGLPVRARPNTVGYRTARFVRRHRAGVATAAAFVALLIGAVATLAVQQAATARQRDLAQEAAREAALQAGRAEQVTAFLAGLFEGSDPSVAQGDTLTARELLSRGVDRIEGLSDQPAIQATLLATTGRIHLGLGDVGDAESLLRRALAVWTGVTDADPGAVATAQLDLGAALELQARHDESGRIYRGLVESRALAERPDLRSRALYGLFTAMHAEGRAAAADSAFDAWADAVQGASRPDARSTREMIRLGQTMMYRGEMERARTLLRRGVENTRALYGDRHPALATALLALSPALADAAFSSEQDDVTREALALTRLLYPGRHQERALALHERALVLQRAGDLAQAEGLMREAIEIETRSDGQDGIGYVSRTRRLAMLLAERGELDEAEGLLREGRDWWRRNFGDTYLFTRAVEADLASVLIRRGRFDEAEALVLPARRQMLEERGLEDPNTQTLTRLLVRLYEAWGRDDVAAGYRAELVGG